MSQHPVHPLRILEPDQAGLGQGVDGNDLGAVGFCLAQHGQHARVVAARILSGDDDQVRMLDVVDGHRPLSDADRLGQRRARGLVAHVGAVGQVVGAETADQQLIAERGLVAGASRGVEDGLIGAVQGGEVVGDQPVGGIPADRPVVVVAGAQHHRVGKPALLAQPVFGFRRQLADRVPGKELRGDRALGGLLGDGLGAVLAELGQLASAVFFRPGAAGTIEAGALVHPSQRRRGAQRAHLLQSSLHRHQHRTHAGRLVLARRDRYRMLVIVGVEVAGRGAV